MKYFLQSVRASVVLLAASGGALAMMPGSSAMQVFAGVACGWVVLKSRLPVFRRGVDARERRKAWVAMEEERLRFLAGLGGESRERAARLQDRVGVLRRLLRQPLDPAEDSGVVAHAAHLAWLHLRLLAAREELESCAPPPGGTSAVESGRVAVGGMRVARLAEISEQLRAIEQEIELSIDHAAVASPTGDVRLRLEAVRETLMGDGNAEGGVRTAAVVDAYYLERS